MKAEEPPVSEALTGKAIAGVSWSAASNIGRQVVAFASATVLARILGPAVYGLMGMASVVIVFLTNFRHLGTAAAIIQRQQISERLLSSLLWVNCALGVLLCGMTFAGAGLVASFFHEPLLVPMMRVISLSFLITSAGTVPSAILARRMQFKQLAITDFTAAVIGYALAIPMAIAGLGIWSLIIANLVNMSTATLGYWFYARWWPSWAFDGREVRTVARFSLNLAGFGIVNYFSRNADNIIIGRRLGPGPLGHYQMAYQLFMLPITNITGIIGQVLNPSFSKIQDDNQRFRSAYIRASMLIGLISFPVIAGLGVVADPLIRTLLGPKWLPVIPIIQVLAPLGILQSVQGTVGHIYVAKGRTDWMFRFGLYVAAVCVISFFIGIHWGAFGVAVAYVVASFTLSAYPIMAIPFRLINLRVSDYLQHLYPQAAITLLMVLITCGWRLLLGRVRVAPGVELVSTVFVGATAYFATLIIIRPRVVQHVEDILASSNRPLARSALNILTWRRH